jgi:Tfp pilus assembly protein PilP
MNIAKTSTRLLAVLALALPLAMSASAQDQPAPKPATKAKAGGAVHHAKAGGTAKPQANPEASPVAAPARDATKTELVGKRDPFAPLINDKKDSVHLPPGKAGLVIATVRVDGAVRSGTTMIAMVSNPEQSVYFIREGDRLYDGDVEKIGLDGVTFRENSKDAFGKPVERIVTKRIYASAGEQQ